MVEDDYSVIKALKLFAQKRKKKLIQLLKVFHIAKMRFYFLSSMAIIFIKNFPAICELCACIRAYVRFCTQCAIRISL